MDFWQDHSLEYLEMAFRTHYRQRLENPDGYGKRTGECGDTVEFFLIVKDGVLTDIHYDIDGCKNTNACANAVVEMARNLTVDDAWEKITPEAVINYLKTLPSHETHCAELAVGAFYLAVRDVLPCG
ncbi:MAG: iron-sulfur cluster assembly scaffold protein [Desulfamplus sp.]|nr:iron-sulfur cluster assembly scaffold protein [Desulfamplus sp.]